MSVTNKTRIYTENYRGYACELHPTGQEWYAKSTHPVEWITSARRSRRAALCALHELIDRYEAARASCGLPPAEQTATGAVQFVAGHLVVPGELVPACPDSPTGEHVRSLGGARCIYCDAHAPEAPPCYSLRLGAAAEEPSVTWGARS